MATRSNLIYGGSGGLLATPSRFLDRGLCNGERVAERRAAIARPTLNTELGRVIVRRHKTTL
jgi:hypothetical protein